MEWYVDVYANEWAGNEQGLDKRMAVLHEYEAVRIRGYLGNLLGQFAPHPTQ